MSKATLTINSRNYGAWSLRGWLLCRFAGLDFEVEVIDSQDPDARAELLLLSPSFLVPRLQHDDLVVWDPLALGEYLHELVPERGLLPADRVARAKCRSIAGEIHSGFANLRSALPMNIKAHHPEFPVWAGAQADIDRIESMWNECLAHSGGPFLFGETRTIADAMYAPVVTRFISYDVAVDDLSKAYGAAIMKWQPMKEWVEDSRDEPQEIIELDLDF